QVGYKVKVKTIKYLIKYCYHYQINQKSPSRFKFTLKNNYNFNFYIIINIIYLSGKPVL
ncbi:uncharacterized protein K441DRAFT_571284, partial [Cenococcum geophilum 1.58]|uniref:uncharacterized protein n=1 Tax=Cenococcum geophilum 1.58 TaxID=794803 RepID=UPI00358FB2A1